jgi:hypothetical protein
MGEQAKMTKQPINPLVGIYVAVQAAEERG